MPLDDRATELFAMRRPGSELDRREFVFLPGTPHIDRFAPPDIRNRSWEIEAEVALPNESAGVVVAAGARTGGYTLFIAGGKLCFAYNFASRLVTRIVSEGQLPKGDAKLLVAFRKTADNTGVLSLQVDGVDVAVPVPLTLLPHRQTLFGLDIGRDLGSTVVADYEHPFDFTGQLSRVVFRLEDDRDDLQAAARVEAENALVDQ